MLEKIRQAIFRVRHGYRSTFLDLQTGAVKPGADVVLADLRRFCRAGATPAVYSQVSGTIDPMATGIAIGRLEVWHRLNQNLHLSDADLVRMMETDAARDQ